VKPGGYSLLNPILSAFAFLICHTARASSVIDSEIGKRGVTLESKDTALADSFGVSTSLVEVTLNLGLVLVAIVVLAWLFKRFQGLDQPAAGQLKVTASLPLGPKERLLVVEVGEEHILVGASSAGINTLHVLSEPLQTVVQDQETFKDKLVRQMKGVQT